MRAAKLAHRAHEGQKRKYTGLPYIMHPARVAGRVMLLDDATAEQVAAAWLHDVIEDCEFEADDLLNEGIPPATVQIVCELTNPSADPIIKCKKLSRFERKELDRAHILGISRPAKQVKLIDRIDNLREMDLADAEFKALYAAESLLLLNIIKDIDEVMAEEFYTVIENLGFQRDHRHPKAEA